ncbi:hypothetical protein D9601_12650 [Sphingomonas sp. MA1305]|uniref:hypothetical protein n=1 Tax=Sphingomonas sp. MA1305 TaxID=2479204 RepID=UPI0018E05BE0|nr:hypothetical protein [Sphingomonas sp. MA1305]MBI0476196.1 hypothetical protein [Sphingomonas sp. MA1305]
MTTSAALALLAMFAGYYGWQRGRYERAAATREAHARALADTLALALIIAGIWLGGWIAPQWGWVASAGSAGASIGALIAVLLAGPSRRAMLRAFRIDPGTQR